MRHSHADVSAAARELGFRTPATPVARVSWPRATSAWAAPSATRSRIRCRHCGVTRWRCGTSGWVSVKAVLAPSQRKRRVRHTRLGDTPRQRQVAPVPTSPAGSEPSRPASRTRSASRARTSTTGVRAAGFLACRDDHTGTRPGSPPVQAPAPRGPRYRRREVRDVAARARGQPRRTSSVATVTGLRTTSKRSATSAWISSLQSCSACAASPASRT